MSSDTEIGRSSETLLGSWEGNSSCESEEVSEELGCLSDLSCSFLVQAGANEGSSIVVCMEDDALVGSAPDGVNVKATKGAGNSWTGIAGVSHDGWSTDSVLWRIISADCIDLGGEQRWGLLPRYCYPWSTPLLPGNPCQCRDGPLVALSPDTGSHISDWILDGGQTVI